MLKPPVAACGRREEKRLPDQAFDFTSMWFGFELKATWKLCKLDQIGRFYRKVNVQIGICPRWTTE